MGIRETMQMIAELKQTLQVQRKQERKHRIKTKRQLDQAKKQKESKVQITPKKVSHGIVVYQGPTGWHFTAKMNGKSITNAKEYISKTPGEAFEKAMLWWQQESGQ